MLRRAHHTLCSGFTLLELVVVMTLLAVVFALAAPRLAGFMAGRNVREEARRILSVTRWAASESVSCGVILDLWFEPKTGTYGVGPIGTDPLADTPKRQFACADTLSLQIDEARLDEAGRAWIRFCPDGTVDEESLERVALCEDQVPRFELARAENGLEYVLEETQGEGR